MKVEATPEILSDVTIAELKDGEFFWARPKLNTGKLEVLCQKWSEEIIWDVARNTKCWNHHIHGRCNNNFYPEEKVLRANVKIVNQ